MITRWRDFGFGDLDRSFRALDELRREMDRLFGYFGPGRLRRTEREGSIASPFKLLDAGESLIVRAEVPGVDEKDIDVSVEPGTVNVRGERKDEHPKGYAVHCKERGSFVFSRAFVLPCKIQTEKVSASLKNGVLELNLPKIHEARPKLVEVHVK